MIDETQSWKLRAVDSPEFERRQQEAAKQRANALIDWVLARPSIRDPFRSAEFRRAFPDVAPGDVKLAIAEIARISRA
jgi:hypothetical protein